MIWIIYPIVCSVLWGIGYTLLRLVSDKLTSFTINGIYGLILFIVNLIASIALKNLNNLTLLKDWKTSLYFSSYIIIWVVTAFIFLLGYNSDGVNAGIYTMISSTYPVITFILSFLLLDQKGFNPYYVSFGIIFTIVGVSLLALSKK
jgi:drug/metabolite transporter (DMT)-like permease